MHLKRHAVALSLGIHAVLAQKVIDLGGANWTLSSRALNISVPGRLPSQAHLDLLAAKEIGQSCVDFTKNIH